MKYNGKELEELTSEKWDYRPRKLLVWGAVNDGYGIKDSIHEEYIEYCIDANSNSTNHTIWEAYIDGHMRSWYHAAEIPKEEPRVKINHKKNVMGTNEQTFDEIIDELKKVKAKYENEIAKLEVENEELKTKVNELKNSCSYRIHSCMCNKIDKLEEQIEKLRSECNSYRMKELLREEFENMDVVYNG